MLKSIKIPLIKSTLSFLFIQESTLYSKTLN